MRALIILDQRNYENTNCSIAQMLDSNITMSSVTVIGDGVVGAHESEERAALPFVEYGEPVRS